MDRSIIEYGLRALGIGPKPLTLPTIAQEAGTYFLGAERASPMQRLWQYRLEKYSPEEFKQRFGIDKPMPPGVAPPDYGGMVNEMQRYTK